MVTSLATLTITDPVLVRWLLSNPQPFAIADRSRDIAIRCLQLSTDTLLQWPLILGVTDTQRYRGGLQKKRQ